MMKTRIWRSMWFLASGALVLQAAGCDLTGLNTVNDYLQTIFLGVTAAGAVAILQNI